MDHQAPRQRAPYQGVCGVACIFLMGIFAVASGPQLAGSVSNPLLHLPLNESSGLLAQDASGNGYSGSLVHFAVDEGDQWVAGKDGGALKFSGGGVVIDNLPEMTSTTWSAWVRVDEAMYFGTVMSAEFPGAGAGHSLGFAGGATTRTTPRALWNHGGDSLSIASTEALEIGEWAHLALTYDGASETLTLFVNGQVHGSGSVPTTAFSTMNLGRRATTGTFPMNGALDQVAIYDRALSESEVGMLANHTVVSNGLVALYEMDDSSGSVVTDSSGNNHHGVLDEFFLHWGDGITNGALNIYGGGHVVSGGFPEVTSTTWAVWVNLNPSTPHFGAAMSAAFPGAAEGHSLGFSTSGASARQPRVLWNHGSSSTTLESPESLVAGEWNHLALTFDAAAGELTLYVNGIEQASGSASTSPFTSINLGRRAASGLYHLDARLADARVYAHVLTPDEIGQLALRDQEGPPVVIVPPEPVTVVEGESATFRVQVDGKAPFSYQWFHDGSPVADSNSAELTLAAVRPDQDGEYVVQITNDIGTVTSDPVRLIVKAFRDPADTLGLVVEYRFDHSSGLVATDSSGNDFHGQLIGFSDATSHWVPGVFGNGLRIQGPGYVKIPEDVPLMTSATWASWYRADSTRNHQSVITATFSGAGAGHVLGVRNGGLGPLQPRALWNHNISATAIVAPALVTVGEWNHLAMTYNAETLELKVYWNGSVIDSATNVQSSPFYQMHIGSRASDTAFFMDGAVDMVQIYDVVLSAEEIQALAVPPEPGTGELRVAFVGFNATGELELLVDTPSPQAEHKVQHKALLEDPEWSDLAGVNFEVQGTHLLASFVLPDPDADRGFFRVLLEGVSPLFLEDFESGGEGWTHGGTNDNWELGAPVNGPGGAHSPENVFATSLSGDTNPNMSAWLRSPPIDLTGVNGATLVFYEWLNIDPNPAFHRTVVRTLDASTLAVLEELDVKAGSVSTWRSRALSLGTASLDREIILEFFISTDAWELREGWYIDDVGIWAD